MSLADIPSLFSSDHDFGGCIIADEAGLPAGNMKQSFSSIDEIKSNLKKNSATKVQTISIDSVMYKNGTDLDYASEDCETAKVIIQ